MNQTCFRFERNQSTALHNVTILEQYNYDLNRIITIQHPSPISYGSEFKSSSDLRELLQHHPHWTHLKDMLNNGATFPLLPISQQEWNIDLEYHKSTTKYKTMPDPIITEDVQRGFSLPLPIDALVRIPNASLAPLGCHKQETIDNEGKKSQNSE
jgi:hypothetical protein